MSTVAYFERREQSLEVEFGDRRLRNRRNGGKAVSADRRRQASEIVRFEGEKLKIGVLLQFGDRQITAQTEIVSPEGILVLGDIKVNTGRPVNLSFSFGKDICYLNLSGQIVSPITISNPEVSTQTIGIKFSGIRDWEKKILYSAIQELKKASSLQDESLLTIHISDDKLALEAARISQPFGVPATEGINQKQNPIETRAKDKEKGEKSRSRPFMSKRKMRKFTPHPQWVHNMDGEIEPYKQAILDSRIVRQASAGTLPLEQMRAWMLQLYPFIETFPKYIALNIVKAQDKFSQGILIDNVRVEKRHAEQWLVMAEGFGIEENQIFHVQPIPEVEALTHWLWSINTQGSLAEAVAANTYAIEGVTQGISEATVKGFAYYDGLEGVQLSKKVYWWMEAHARYDDEHPLEALEIIKLYATTADLQEKVTFATKRSLEYLLLALDACYDRFCPNP